MAEQQLTVNDPIDETVFEQLVTLRDAKQQMALKLLDLENEKIQILAAAKRTEMQSRRLFEQILIEREMDPSSEVFIDSKTRKLIPQESVKETSQEASEKPEEG